MVVCFSPWNKGLELQSGSTKVFVDVDNDVMVSVSFRLKWAWFCMFLPLLFIAYGQWACGCVMMNLLLHYLFGARQTFFLILIFS